MCPLWGCGEGAGLSQLHTAEGRLVHPWTTLLHCSKGVLSPSPATRTLALEPSNPQQTKLPTPDYSKLSQRTIQISCFCMLRGRLDNNTQDVALKTEVALALTPEGPQKS